MTDYYNKYLKYKNKYLELKNNDMIGGGKKILDIDHVMFPVYNNNNFLDEVANEYIKNKKYIYSIGKQGPPTDLLAFFWIVFVSSSFSGYIIISYNLS